ncbi:PD-(D/E)XK nuclease family protein [Massilia arenae]|nr:PD-(D/E)XK nuclease family protein [Massilia arenae]
MHDSALQNQLQLLCDEPDFQILRARLNRFDPFKALKVERYELRHTTTLAWLLDPQQTHGLGDSFLRAFLHDIRDAAGQAMLGAGQPLIGHVAVQPELRLSGGQLHAPVTDDTGGAVAAARMTGELDVLIESETWAVAIEAKIDSREGQWQLRDYGQYLKARFGGRKRLALLYLTVQPETDVIEENPDWTGIQWGGHAVTALRSSLKSHYGSDPQQALASCPADARALCEFLHGYLDLLDRLGDTLHGVADTVQKLADRYYGALGALKKALRQCEDEGLPVLPWSTQPSWSGRYWADRQLFDILVGRMRSPEAGFAAAVVERVFAPAAMPLNRFGSGINSATVRFVPQQWMDWQVGQDDRRAPLHTLMHYHVAFRNVQRDIEIKLLLPRSLDHDLQVRLVEQLLTLEKARGSASLQPKAPYLGDFLEPTGKSLKLYTDSLAWRLDGTDLALVDGADDRIAAFWHAVAEHTALLEKILSTDAR